MLYIKNDYNIINQLFLNKTKKVLGLSMFFRALDCKFLETKDLKGE